MFMIPLESFVKLYEIFKRQTIFVSASSPSSACQPVKNRRRLKVSMKWKTVLISFWLIFGELHFFSEKAFHRKAFDEPGEAFGASSRRLSKDVRISRRLSGNSCAKTPESAA